MYYCSSYIYLYIIYMYIVGFDLLIFLKDLCVYIHEESWSTIFFFSNLFI